MSFDLQQFSTALQDLIVENYELRRELELANIDLDEELAERELPQARGLGDEPGLTSAEEVAARQLQVVQTARSEWQATVLEPPGSNWEHIGARYIAGEHGLAWKWVHYVKNGKPAWCGAFAAYCYGMAGLRHRIRFKHLASCRRLCAWSRGTARRIDWQGSGDIRPGDIVIVGKPTGLPTGQHITICERFDAAAGLVHTFEGNAHGTIPSGAWREGVISRTRPMPSDALGDRIMRVMHVIRPLPEDFVASLGG